jgi:predicted dehydrogenase
VRREENVWWSFAPHDVSVILELLGKPQLKGVVATGHAMLQPGIEDNIHVDLVFAGGQTAHVHCSWYWPTMARNTVVIGDKQMLVYDEVLQKITIYDKGVDQDFNNRDGGSEVVEVADSQPLRIECQHFLDCVKSRQRPISDGWNGVAVVEILEKATELLNG